jgi:polyisoprenoid-binding protein YceI
MSTTSTELSQLTGEYTLDPAHTRIGFVARHAMVTKVRGAFNEFTGSARIDGVDLAGSSVRVDIDVASIDTRNPDRDAHLRGADFLQIERYPRISFVSTQVRPTADGVQITGDLTIKGVTRQVSVPFSFEGEATDPFGNTRVGFEGSTTINRRDFGITWNAALETGGVLVGNKVTLEFDISAVKQA